MGDQGAKLSVRYFAALPEPEGRPDAFPGSILWRWDRYDMTSISPWILRIEDWQVPRFSAEKHDQKIF